MPGLNPLTQNKYLLNDILDTNWSPVAKFRLLSDGVSPNHLLDDADNIVGQRACIACGNCVDACPVLLRERNKAELQMDRNSLYLETVVDDSCLRCYNCIRSCPQVDYRLKAIATNHRMKEKLVHWWMAVGYLLLASTGIALNHMRGMWDVEFVTLISWAHRFGALVWLSAPFLFAFIAPSKFGRMMKNVFHITGKDFAWWKQAFSSKWRGANKPYQGEYNSGQKAWYMVIFLTMLVLGVTGIARWVLGGLIVSPDASDATMILLITIHAYAALVIDLSFAFHFGRKAIARLTKRFMNVRRLSKVVEIEGSGQPALKQDIIGQVAVNE